MNSSQKRPWQSLILFTIDENYLLILKMIVKCSCWKFNCCDCRGQEKVNEPSGEENSSLDAKVHCVSFKSLHSWWSIDIKVQLYIIARAQTTKLQTAVIRWKAFCELKYDSYRTNITSGHYVYVTCGHISLGFRGQIPSLHMLEMSTRCFYKWVSMLLGRILKFHWHFYQNLCRKRRRRLAQHGTPSNIFFCHNSDAVLSHELYHVFSLALQLQGHW